MKKNKLKKSNYEKKIKYQIVTKLKKPNVTQVKNSNYDITQKLKL